MRSLSDLLQNHAVPGIRLSQARTTIAKAAGALAKWNIGAKDVKFKEGVAFFSVPSVVKTELLLRADDLKRVLTASGVTLTDLK